MLRPKVRGELAAQLADFVLRSALHPSRLVWLLQRVLREEVAGAKNDPTSGLARCRAGYAEETRITAQGALEHPWSAPLAALFDEDIP